MPIYEYRCQNGHAFEALHSMSEEPISSCRECGAPTERVYHPVAVHFKGSGFYSTDYARKGSGAKSGEDGGKPDSKPSESESKPDSSGGDAKKAKTEAGSS